MARRKHHCRSCGGIFCSTCAGQFRPVPSEQLYDPVRVCDACNTKAALDKMGEVLNDVAVEQAVEAVLAVSVKGDEIEN